MFRATPIHYKKCVYHISLLSRYTGSVIGETDIFNNNRYEYYCVSCEDVNFVVRFYIANCSSSSCFSAARSDRQ